MPHQVAALGEATQRARCAVDQPVEGTILTVAHEVARAAASLAESGRQYCEADYAWDVVEPKYLEIILGLVG